MTDHDPQTLEGPSPPVPVRFRSRWLRDLGLVALFVIVAGLAARSAWRGELPGSTLPAKESSFMPNIEKTDDQWRAQLTAEQYRVTREKGTERPFTGEFWNHHEKGQYKCVGCGAELFTSDTKYDSGCGWPSFYASDFADNLHTEEDHSHGMVRVEVMCKNCGAHLGHVFDDGPRPTGARYCMNSAALAFDKNAAKKLAPEQQATRHEGESSGE